MWLLKQTIVLALAMCAYGAWPTAKSTKTQNTTIKVNGTVDGGLVRYIAGSALGDGAQGENQLPIFEVADGGVLKNVIIGTPAADGVHCLGSCTLENIWWEDVGEDAATFKGKSSSTKVLVNGGGAQKASDKVFQHNGAGTVTIQNFQVSDFGKLYRSCGNCATQYARKVILSGITATSPGKILVGINPNYGDSAKFSGITIVGDSSKKIVICERYKGVTSGKSNISFKTLFTIEGEITFENRVN